VFARISGYNEGKIVSSVEGLLRFLESKGLAHRMRIHCANVGVHTSNRDSYGINGRDVQGLAKDIFVQGWSFAKVKDAIAVEIPPADTEIETFNKKLVANSQGLLAPIEPGSLKIASLTKGHTTQMLRCIHYGVDIADEAARSLMGIDGKFNVEKIRGTCLVC
jgi:hypothetical protein